MRSKGPRLERFARAYLRHPTGKKVGQPFLFENWQRAFATYFHQLDAHGRRVFRLGILGVPRGSGKSPLAAAHGLYEMLARKDAPQIYCVSASRELANVVHNFARAFVENGPLQHHGVRSGRHQISYPAGNAFFEALPASGALATGRSAATIIGDELWAFLTHVQKETWVQMWTTMHKRDDPYALGITTAGWDKATLLGETYDEALQLPPAPIEHSNPCLRIHEDRQNGILLWWYGIPEELHHQWDNPALWRAANPASWIEIDDLRKQLAAPGFSELDFQRLHLNMWCLEPTTPVSMADGTLCPAAKVRPGDAVVSWDAWQRRLVTATVGAAGFVGEQTIYEIETSRGRRIRVSPEHPFWVRGGRSDNPTYGWTEARNLKPGDRIGVALGWQPQKARAGGFAEAHFLGLLVGDGYIPARGQVGFTCQDDDVVAAAAYFAEHQFGFSLRPQGGHPSKYRFSRGADGAGKRSALRQFVREHGLEGRRAHEKHVPGSVMEGGPEAWAGFLSGYLDTDGHVGKEMIVWVSVSRQLLEECQHLLAMLGAQSTLRPGRRSKLSAHDVWRLEIYDATSFNVLRKVLLPSAERKRSALTRLPATIERPRTPAFQDRRRFDRVKQIAVLPPQPTFGIEVLETHSHITAGLITHNTSAREAWLPTGVWSDLVDTAPLAKGAPIYVGVDVGWNDDSTAVCWASRLPDGRIAVRAKIWTTRRDQVGEFVEGGTMRLELVERFIVEQLKPSYRIKEVAFDPTYFGRSAEIVESHGLRGKLVEMPPWHNHTASAWEEFKQLAIEKGLCHDGDKELAAHVAAAGTQMTANGPRVRKTASGKIDALAACVLAVSRCQLNTKPTRTKPGVFWMNPDEA